MAFWNSPAVEPKRQFRWLLTLGNGIPQWIIKSVTKPIATTTDVAHKYFGYTYYYPGTTTWNTIDITLVDPVSPDAAQTIATILRQSGYRPPQNDTDLYAISKENANNAFGSISIRQVDAQGDELEAWELNNPFVTVADFGGTLSYDQDALVDLKMTIRYDWASLVTRNRGASTAQVGGVQATATRRWVGGGSSNT
jgi:hypothetical protein